MPTPLQYISTIHRSPVIFSQLFPVFFGNLSPRESSFMLSYLLIPLYIHRESRSYIENSRSNSSIRVLASDQERISGLQERVLSHIELTNESLLAAQSADFIQISPSVVISVTTTPRNAFGEKFSLKFARLVEQYSVQEIFRTLGVNRI